MSRLDSVQYAMQPSYNNAQDDDMDDDTFSVVSADSTGSMRFSRSSSSATSHDWEMRSASPAPSTYSMTSSLRAASYVHEFGRGINNYSEVYRLPADEEEFDRLGARLFHVLTLQCSSYSQTINTSCSWRSWVDTRRQYQKYLQMTRRASPIRALISDVGVVAGMCALFPPQTCAYRLCL